MNAVNFYHSTSTLRLCIDCAQGGRISGRVFSGQLSAPLPFSDLGLLLLDLDALMDLQNYPQSFQRKRIFRGCQGITLPASFTEPPLLSMDQVLAAQGDLYTLDLQIQSRQNATWQGHVLFHQEGTAVSLPLQSDLDLLHLITNRIPYRN